MRIISKYSKYIPYLYFIAMVAYWFTDVNRAEGLSAYPILLFGIPFVWQLIKPSKKLNFSLGIIFVCLSSYMVMAYLSDAFQLIEIAERTKRFLILGGLFVVGNLFMSLWMIRNSIKQAF